ncbi:hypothetical protein EXIGLDRAFT_780260 [Exidia glandulosa HHB12029]|uniref:Uncharacterized protein n=1 Tax=Exidia glandulosa HHB12029 TaxID=1314781 RepID=A0A165BPN8_EXIGL|nr:hypothetical protein EXIGLDRAFT_780260 [Exidia glandulosa HHB12029]
MSRGRRSTGVKLDDLPNNFLQQDPLKLAKQKLKAKIPRSPRKSPARITVTLIPEPEDDIDTQSGSPSPNAPPGDDDEEETDPKGKSVNEAKKARRHGPAVAASLRTDAVDRGRADVLKRQLAQQKRDKEQQKRDKEQLAEHDDLQSQGSPHETPEPPPRSQKDLANEDPEKNKKRKTATPDPDDEDVDERDNAKPKRSRAENFKCDGSKRAQYGTMTFKSYGGKRGKPENITCRLNKSDVIRTGNNTKHVNHFQAIARKSYAMNVLDESYVLSIAMPMHHSSGQAYAWASPALAAAMPDLMDDVVHAVVTKTHGERISSMSNALRALEKKTAADAKEIARYRTKYGHIDDDGDKDEAFHDGEWGGVDDEPTDVVEETEKDGVADEE